MSIRQRMFPTPGQEAGQVSHAHMRRFVFNIGLEQRRYSRKPLAVPAGTGAVVGIDRGCVNTLALADGTTDQIPTLTDGEQARFLALEQRLASQTDAAKREGRRLAECNNRTKTLDALANLRQRLTDRRRDWIEQTTTRLAGTYDVVVLEELNIAGMVKKPAPKPDPDQPGAFLPNRARAKAALARAIHASCWGLFAQRLGHKTNVVFINPRYTSQECRRCGHTVPENRKSQAEFRCVECGHENHADTNAAENILNRGEEQALHVLANNPGDAGDLATLLPEGSTVAINHQDAGTAA